MVIALKMLFLQLKPIDVHRIGTFLNYQASTVIQNFSATSLTHQIAFFLAFSLSTPFAIASPASEPASFDVMLRQLNAFEETARHSAQVSDEPGKRYSFDYQRLTDDIARIRQGLKDYLSPSRAQPRDPVELSGNYTTEGRQP